MSPVKAALRPRYSLEAAVRLFFPGGDFNRDSLKYQIRKGRLRAELIGGKYFTTEADLLAMCQAGECNAPAAPADDADVAAHAPDGGQHG